MSKQLYLAHHGVKGQKWGVHNDPEKDYQDLEAGLRGGGGLVELPSEEELQERMDDLLEAYEDGNIDREKYEDLKGRYEKLIQRFRKLKQSNQELGTIKHGDYLMHHGVKGQKHGVRQWQNEDGSLTPAGRIHYGVGAAREKVGKVAKSVGRVVKKKATDLRAMRTEAKAANRERRVQLKEKNKEDRAARREESLNSKIKRIEQRDARRAAVREYQMERAKRLQEKYLDVPLSDVLRDADISAAQKRVDRLTAKRDRIRKREELRIAEKELRKNMKRVKKEARRNAAKRISNNDIKEMSDADIDARIARLRKEDTLRKLELETRVPKSTKMGANFVEKTVTDLGNNILAGVMGSVKTGAGAAVIPLLKEAGIEKADIDEYIRWTKKK